MQNNTGCHFESTNGKHRVEGSQRQINTSIPNYLNENHRWEYVSAVVYRKYVDNCILHPDTLSGSRKVIDTHNYCSVQIHQ